MNAAGYIRRAHHAGSWYSADKATLDETLTAFLQDASSTTAPAPTSSLKAVICPHAGYSYSGPTAAYSYLPLQQELERNGRITTILVLHPSHHVYLEGCAISGATILETPLGNLQVDDELRNELLERGNKLFSVMNQKVDEHEHSGEMQYPYIAKACAGRRQYIRVLPIMVGNTNTRQEERYGTILAPIIARLNVVCVISSDFMHWGSRFQYQPTPSSKSMQIYQYIQQLDQQGMDLITLQEPGAFAKYLKETKNTICGRHPIGVWLQAVHVNSMPKVENLQISFVQYNQSSQVQSMRDSSVSYASAIATRTSES